MMPATHMLMGILVGFSVRGFFPVGPELLIFAGLLGGAFPDLDILHGHRKWLHYPFLYGIGAAFIGFSHLYYPSGWLVLLLVFVLSAWIHSFLDIFAGAELRSWDETEWRDHAVYSHLTRSWISPRRLAYGGSPQDFLISLVTGIMLLTVLPPDFHFLAGALLLLAVTQTLTIKFIASRIPEHHPTWAHFFQTLVFGEPKEHGL